jgi:alpha-1,6-mannosyltransferase
MRILQLANFVHSSSGGLGVALRGLADSHERAGHDVEAILPKEPSASNRIERSVRSMRLPTSGGYRVIVDRRSVIDAIDQFVPDLVELHDKTTLYWVARHCRTIDIPCVVVSHERSDMVAENRGVMTSMVRAFTNRARAEIEKSASSIVCASRFAAEEWSVAAPVDIVPFGVDHEIFAPGVEAREWRSTLHIVICGRLSHEKGVTTAMQAMIELARRRPIALLVIGEGPLRAELSAASSALDVEFLGHVSDRWRVAHFLRDADLVVNLGPRETFGLASVEALACGTPVVVAASGASLEIVRPEFGRTACGVHDVVEMIDEMTSQSRSVMSEAARRFALQFEWAVVAGRIRSHARVGATS